MLLYISQESKSSSMQRTVVNFILVVPCIVNLLYVSNQLDAVLSSLFIVLQNHSTCFGCPLHPSSGVHKTVVWHGQIGHAKVK